MKRLLALLLSILCLSASSALAEPVQMAAPDDLPELTEDGFLPAGEAPRYYKQHAEGCWVYVDQQLRLTITRYQKSSPALTYYVADLVMADNTAPYTVSFNEKKPGRTNGLPQDMAARARAVYAQSGDFYSYRIAKDRYPGNIVRGGKVIKNKSYSKMVHATPNLATIGFYPSGRAEVNEAWEKSAKKYVKEGASDVLAFGPILLRDGEAADLTDEAYTHKEPRSCFGVVDAGHFIGLLVEGRKNHSEGATLADCAKLLAEIGCASAINLDGGNTAAMLFMGESVQLSENGGVDENTRAIPDILCAGSY